MLVKAYIADSELTVVIPKLRNWSAGGTDGARVAGACRLCACDRIDIVDQFPFRDLRLLYFETCEVDIVDCLDKPHHEEMVYLYRCQECLLEFYPSQLRGNEKLYDALKKFDCYYMKDKWEFDVALQDARDAKSILEIGCGPGFFLDKVKSIYRKKKVTGLELSRDAVQACQEKGLEVEKKTIEEFSRGIDWKFDLVCAF